MAATCSGKEKSPLRAVIFDCDGILVDTEPLHYRAFQEVLVPLGLGHDYARYTECFIGFDDRDAFIYAFQEAGKELDPETLGLLIEAKANALDMLVERGVSTFPGVVDLVRNLHAERVPMAVASGALRYEVKAFVRSLGLGDAFRVIVAADDVEKSKPDPETYLRALERLRDELKWRNSDPRGCIAVEDTPAGIHSARTAGLTVIAVTNSFPGDQLLEADQVVESLAGLDRAKLEKLVARQAPGV